MDVAVVLAIALAVVVIVAIAAFVAAKRRRDRLQERFGPEYERAVSEHDSKLKAESELAGLERRHDKLDIRPLTTAERDRFARSWTEVQATFVDDPSGALAAADELVQDVMRTRGYPVESFDQQASDVSVEHPSVVKNYRAAHAISLATGQGHASTEDQRQGMVHYRSLFSELLVTDSDQESDEVVRIDDRRDANTRF